jgi:NAD(P)-dependent dehydrogenase (short-subunit alcohol dehydrogenase family)
MSMAGRVCVVTGATSGIGKSIALGLARTGATLTIVGRDRARGEAAVAEMRAASGNPDVQLALANLASQAEVRRLGGELLERLPCIHVLVNNAGIVNLRHATTPDGIESVFAVNHLAYFLLTTLLLERLRASAPARVVNVASDAHRWGTIDFDDLGHERRYRAMRVYGSSKLANVLFTAELARRLEGSGVTVNCLHPGAVATRLGQNNGRVATALTRVLAPFFRSPDQGADTAIWLASSPDVEGMSGLYFADRKPRRPSRAAEDTTTATRLWELSQRMTAPRVQTS